MMSYLIFLSVFIVSYIVYWLTWPPTVFWQDSGIFLTAIKVLGVAYPPGFPLYVMGGHLFTKIIPWGNFAQKVHAFSSIWGAGAASIMALCAWEIIKISNIKNQKVNISNGDSPGVTRRGSPGVEESRGVARYFGGVFASLIIGLTTAFSYSLWAQSINAEVYSFHAFFTAAFLYFLVLIWRESGFRLKVDKLPRKVLLLFAVVLGLSFANHPLAVTFLVPLAYLLYQNREVVLKKWGFFLLLFLIFFLAGTLPYLYLPIRARAKPVLNWGDPSTPKRVLQHMLRREYMTRRQYIAEERTFVFWDFKKIKTIAILFWEEFFVLPIIFGLAGLFYLYKKDKEMLKVSGLLAVTLLSFLLFYTGHLRGVAGEYPSWLIPFYLYFILMFAFGLRWFLLKFKNQQTALLAAIMIGLFSAGILFLVNLKYLDRTNYYTAADFGKNILRPLEKNSILFIIGDQPRSTVLYLQAVEGYRSDVMALSINDLETPYVTKALAARFPHVRFPQLSQKDVDLGSLVNQFVDLNLNDHAIYFMTLKNIPADFKYPLIASGAFWKVSKDENEVINERYWDFQFTDPKFYQKPMKKEADKKVILANGEEGYIRVTYHQKLIDFLAQAYKNLGDWYFVRGDCGKAIKAYEKIFKYQSNFSHKGVLQNLARCKMK